MDAVWVDDLQRQLHVLFGGEREGNYAAYEDGAKGVAALARIIERGWLFEGEHFPPWNESREAQRSVTRSPWGVGEPHAGRRGAPATGLPRTAFLYAFQNHDHIGNRARGDRACHHLSLEQYRAAVRLLFFLPGIPLMFMGQEWAASTPFPFFTDHHEALGALV